MKILTIIIKEFKQNIRNYKANTMMVLFPIVLIIILGAAFSGQFNSSIKLNDAVVLYKVDDNVNTQFTEPFDSFLKQLTGEIGIRFERTDDLEAGKAGIEDYKYSAFIHVTGNPLKIDLYKNERTGFNATLMESALNSYIKTTNAMYSIARNNPTALGNPEMMEYDGHVAIRSLDKKRQPGSTDYYAVTMLTLILLYGSLTGFWGIRGELEQKTAGRILCSPVRDFEFMTGKVVGGIIVTVLQGAAVILFSKLILKAYWGDDLLPVALLILTYSIMTISLGVALSYTIKSSEAASGILNTLIPVMVFLGGGYVPLSVMSGAILKIAVISPVRWVNSALFKVIYDRDYSAIPISVAFNLGLAALFILLAAVFSGRRNRANA